MSRIGKITAPVVISLALGAIAVPPSTAEPSGSDQNAPSVVEGFPDVADVGFHHLALLYHDANSTPASFLPYVNRVDGNGSVTSYEPLFDAFLLLSFTAPTGASMDYGKLTVEDWISTLDMWFGPAGQPGAGDLAKLDQAVAQAAAVGQVTEDVRDVVIMMPWMSGEQRDFGDLGDGQGSRDLADPADRRAVAAWFTQQVADKFAAADFDHLDLWGMYRMREDVTPWEQAPLGPGGAPVAASDAQGVKDVDPDLGYLFVPYYNGPGWDTWDEYGFTAAIMQPSYAFRGVMDGGRVDAGRLGATASRAAEHGLGVEIEVRGCQSMPMEQAVLQGYLAAGTTYGYQQAPNAYFLGANLATCGAVTSGDPAQRGAYDALADYITGDPIAWPDIEPTWTHTTPSGTHTWTATGVDPGPAGGARIELTESNLSQAWQGSVEVFIRPTGGSGWTPAGWSVRGAPDRIAGSHQSIAVPLAQEVLAGAAGDIDVRVRMKSSAASPAQTPAVESIVLDPAQPSTVTNPAAHSAVVVESPARPQGPYPDPNGTKLTDGFVSNQGWTSTYDVGWTSDPGQAAIVVDLGATYPVDQIRVHGQGGSDAGVNWPVNPTVLLGASTPVVAPEGAGPKPAGIQAIPFGSPVVTGQHASGLQSDLPMQCGDPGAPNVLCTNQDGYLDAASSVPVDTRYVTVFLGTTGWAMLSEIDVYAGGNHITPAGYRLYRQPNGDGESYVDDGLRLVDGHVADDFAWRMFSGWSGDTPVTLRLDLPEQQDLAEVSLWTAELPAYGIVTPTGFTAEVTTDGQTWQAFPGTLAVEQFGTAGRKLTLTGQASVADVSAIRISLPGDHGGWAWHMLSEVTTDSAASAVNRQSKDKSKGKGKGRPDRAR